MTAKTSFDDEELNEKYGLRSRRCPPQIKKMIPFEEDMAKLIQNLEFRKICDDFQKQLRADAKTITSSSALLVPPDKSRNLYGVGKDQYTKLVHDNVTKHYRHAPSGTYDETNTEALKITTKLKIADRLDTLAQKEAFLTIKDHKENFPNSIPCRLINAAKTELGMVSKRMLDRINSELRKNLPSSSGRTRQT